MSENVQLADTQISSWRHRWRQITGKSVYNFIFSKVDINLTVGWPIKIVVPIVFFFCALSIDTKFDVI